MFSRSVLTSDKNGRDHQGQVFAVFVGVRRMLRRRCRVQLTKGQEQYPGGIDGRCCTDACCSWIENLATLLQLVVQARNTARAVEVGGDMGMWVRSIICVPSPSWGKVFLQQPPSCCGFLKLLIIPPLLSSPRRSHLSCFLASQILPPPSFPFRIA